MKQKWSFPARDEVNPTSQFPMDSFPHPLLTLGGYSGNISLRKNICEFFQVHKPVIYLSFQTIPRLTFLNTKFILLLFTLKL